LLIFWDRESILLYIVHPKEGKKKSETVLTIILKSIFV
jgi:hypothetical protein